jgi:hypothetical protein
MESSIAVFLERQSACEPLPTASGVRTLQKEVLEWRNVKRIQMWEGVYQNLTPGQRFQEEKLHPRKLLFFTWVLMHARPLKV